MKITKRIAQGTLSDYIETQLPRSLVVTKIPVGYGYVQYVYIRGHEPGFITRLVFGSAATGDPVAFIGERDIELYHPQYQADFEDIIRSYERNYEGEIELKVWNV